MRKPSKPQGDDVVTSCPQCGDVGPHYVPPSLGEPGFYTCQPQPPGSKMERVAFQPDAPDKGEYMGACNRRACQDPGATWYNSSTRAYYCECCASRINRENNTEYCTEGEYDGE